MIYQTFPTIISGTITRLRISNVASYYFLDNLPADVLRFAGSGNEVHISDGTKTKKVLLGALGTGETYADIVGGTDPALLNGNFSLGDTGWTKGTGVTIGSGVCTADGSGADFERIIERTALSAPVGKLYQTSATLARTAGAFRVGLGGYENVGVFTATFVSYLTVSTAAANNNVRILDWTGYIGTIDLFTIRQVLTPSALGLWYTPVSEEATWNPNAATHTYKVLAKRRCSGKIFGLNQTANPRSIMGVNTFRN